jgi:hypothetical protein
MSMASSVVLIEPEGIYDDASLGVTLEVSASALRRARENGRLRHSRQGQRILYLGKWVLAWLEADARPQEGRGDA